MAEIWGAALGLVGAVGGGMLASSGARSAANSTNAANAQLAGEQNAYNQEQFRLGRGEGGSAVLPTYLNPGANIGVQQVFAQFPELQADYMRQKALHGDKLPPPEQWLQLAFERQPAGMAPIQQWIESQQAQSPEARLANDIIAGYDTGREMFGTPAEQAARVQGTLDRFQPAMDASGAVVSRVLDGGVAGDRSAAQGGVEGAREAGLGGTATARQLSEPALAAYLAEQESRLGALGGARTLSADEYAGALGASAGDQARTLGMSAEQYAQALAMGAGAQADAVLAGGQAQREAVDVAQRGALNQIATQRALDGYSGASTGFSGAVARSLLGARSTAAIADTAARTEAARLRGDAGVGGASARGAAAVEGSRLVGEAGVGGANARGTARVANATDMASVNPAQVGLLTAQNALTSATDRATAGEQNALERRALVDQNLQTQLGAIDLPFALAERQVGMTRLPREALYADALAAQNPLGFFRLGEARAPTAVGQPAPVVAPGASSMVGSAMMNVGGEMLQDVDWGSIFRRRTPAATATAPAP